MLEISVIIPIFNNKSTIIKTLDSVIIQDFKSIQIVLIDDKSYDDSIIKIENYIKSINRKNIEFNLLRNTCNSGAGYSRNQGIKVAKYEWIAFLDSDDIWLDNKFAKCFQKMKENNFSIDMIIHWENFIDKNNEIRLMKNGFTKPLELSNKIVKKLYSKNNFSTSAILLKREILINNRFDQTLPNAQDYDLWLRLCINNNLKILTIKEVLGIYNQRAGSITSKPYYKRIRSLLRIAIRYRKEVSKFTFFLKLIKITFSTQWLKSIFKIY